MSKGLLTTSVGSFPKPDYLVSARNKHARGDISDQELQKLERQATEHWIRVQEELGLCAETGNTSDAKAASAAMARLVFDTVRGLIWILTGIFEQTLVSVKGIHSAERDFLLFPARWWCWNRVRQSRWLSPVVS